MHCSTGLGVCYVMSTYMCTNGVLQCTLPDVPMAKETYMTMPDTKTGSWDYNCNGSEEMACAVPQRPAR